MWSYTEFENAWLDDHVEAAESTDQDLPPRGGEA